MSNSKNQPAIRLAANVAGMGGNTASTSNTYVAPAWKPGVQVGMVIKATGLGKPVAANSEQVA